MDAIGTSEGEIENDPKMIKFCGSVNDGEYKEIVAYNDIFDFIERDETQEGIWKFKAIIWHQGPLSAKDASYKVYSSFSIICHMFNIIFIMGKD